MDSCRTTLKRTDCGGTITNSVANSYAPFDVCLPFGRVLRYDGVGLKLDGAPTISDGVYGTITVENGCITGAAEQPACEYTPPACTPAATPCGDSSSGVTLASDADNLLYYNAAGALMAKLVTESTDNIQITGYGTADQPLKITYIADEAESTVVKTGTAAVMEVTGTGSGTDPYYVNHKESGVSAGTVNGITVDEYGHITAIEEVTTAVTSVTGGPELNVSQQGSMVTIDLPAMGTTGSYLCGGFTLTADMYGRLTDITQSISLNSGASVTLDPQDYTLTFNTFGSLIGYDAVTRTADEQFAEIFEASRDSTDITITTTKNAYFKIVYRGLLASTATTIKGFYSLPSPYQIRVDGRRVTAYALYDTNKTGIVEVMALTDAYYGPGDHTVELYCTTSDFTFTDISMLSVDLVQRGS